MSPADQLQSAYWLSLKANIKTFAKSKHQNLRTRRHDKLIIRVARRFARRGKILAVAVADSGIPWAP
jgi:hypothetical protein